MKTIEFVIDTSAWVEYFRGSAKGQRVKEVIEKGEIGASVLSIAELSDKYEREHLELSHDLSFMAGRAAILPVEIEDAALAGSLKQKARKSSGKFGLVDALILLQAKRAGSVLITFDKDFEGLENVRVLA